jgi:hypothetical protein
MWHNGKPEPGIDINEELAAMYPHNHEGGGHFDNLRRADGTVVRPKDSSYRVHRCYSPQLIAKREIL